MKLIANGGQLELTVEDKNEELILTQNNYGQVPYQVNGTVFGNKVIINKTIPSNVGMATSDSDFDAE